MGPRPPRRIEVGAGAAGGAPKPPVGTSRPVEVVKVRNRHAPAPDTAPLPPAVLDALAAIARDMRDIPRDCIVDRMELMHWLRRMAGRVDGVAKLRVVVEPSRPKRRPAASSGAARAGSAREQAEAVFGKAPPGRVAEVARTITSRKGRRVRVEVRRARAAGQMELGL